MSTPDPYRTSARSSPGPGNPSQRWCSATAPVPTCATPAWRPSRGHSPRPGISTLRFNFPFKELGKSRVDAQDVSVATVAAALAFARETFDGPHYLGGHSYGGRMATHAVVDRGLDAAGLIFGSFPLHPAGKPSTRRADHMDAIDAPMLFLSGTRDGLAHPEPLTQVVDRLGATLRWLDTADHGYRVLKRTRTRGDDVFTEMAAHAREFVLG